MGRRWFIVMGLCVFGIGCDRGWAQFAEVGETCTWTDPVRFVSTG